MSLMCDFDETLALDNAAILRGLTQPWVEYGESQLKLFVIDKCREMGFPSPCGYYRLSEWMLAMSRLTNVGALYNVIDSNPDNHAYWLYLAYDAMCQVQAKGFMGV